MPLDYNQLLDENYLVSFLNGISANDTNPTIKTAAKNLAFIITGNKIIPNYPYYNELYKKYQFKLQNVNTNDGLKIVVYSWVGQNIKFIGQSKSQVSNFKITNTIIVDIPTINELVTPTYDTKPIISGNSQSSVSIEIYDNDILLGKTTSDVYGYWSFTPISDLSLGTHSFTALAKIGDVKSGKSSPVTIIIQSVDAPIVYVNSPTTNPRSAIYGISLPSGIIEIFDSEISIGTTNSDINGNWLFIPSVSLTNGSHTITATSTVDGNTSDPSSPVTLIVNIKLGVDFTFAGSQITYTI